MNFEVYKEIEDFLEHASDKTRKIIIKKLELFSNYEKRVLERSGDLKRLDKKVYEIIIGPWRLLGWMIGNSLHLTVIFRKKSNKTPKRHINNAEQRGKELEKST